MARRAASDDGFTLIELVVAISIFAIIMIGIAGTLGAGLRMTGSNRRRTVAANLASQEMDVVRSADFQSLVPRTVIQNVDTVPYTVHRELTWVAKSATAGPCDAGGGGVPQLLPRAHRRGLAHHARHRPDRLRHDAQSAGRLVRSQHRTRVGAGPGP